MVSTGPEKGQLFQRLNLLYESAREQEVRGKISSYKSDMQTCKHFSTMGYKVSSQEQNIISSYYVRPCFQNVTDSKIMQSL